MPSAISNLARRSEKEESDEKDSIIQMLRLELDRRDGEIRRLKELLKPQSDQLEESEPPTKRLKRSIVNRKEKNSAESSLHVDEIDLSFSDALDDNTEHQPMDVDLIDSKVENKGVDSMFLVQASYL